MTTEEFNKKYNNFLGEGHYGMDIAYPSVINYVDKEFSKEIENNKNFVYYQIKLKFGRARVYTNNNTLNSILEERINQIINDEKN